MSVIAWNGKILAAERIGITSDMRIICPKLIDFGDGVAAAFTGNAAQGGLLVDWWRNGCNKEKWPKFQETEDWSRLVIAAKGRCFYYEKQPFELEVFLPFCAWGLGRDFAMGAMEMGADPIKAIEIASKWSIGCGFGIDSADVGAP